MADKKPAGQGPPNRLVLVLLSLLTLLLLAANLSYFSSEPIRQQLSAWVWERVRPPTAQSPASAEPLGPHRAAVSTLPAGTELDPEPTVQAGVEPEEDQLESREVVENLQLLPEPRRNSGVGLAEESPRPRGRLIIPALELDLPLDIVPVVDGHWDISELDDGIGWMQTTGTRPGDELAMVIIGHVTLPPPGGPGPFMQLAHLKMGEKIYYQDGDRLYTYEIDQRFGIKPDEVEAIYEPDGERIILVTCIGWNPVSREYEHRLLVQAALVRSERLQRMVD